MTTAEILRAFSDKSALVMGDICLDRWCTYDPAMAEPSRETGIPRIGVVATECTPGAGGNVANNLAALGIGRAAVLGVVGQDGYGHELTRALNSRGILTDLLVRSGELPTFTYTKLINAHTGVEDLPRLDLIHTRALPDRVEGEMLDHLREFAPNFDIIFVSDQADTKRGGVVTPAVRTELENIAQLHPEKIIWVDSRVRIERFRHMVLKPNQKEADVASTALFGQVDYQRLRAHTNAPVMFITQSARGVLVVDEKSETHLPARQVERAVDVTGAGDTFSAGAAVVLLLTGSAEQAARFGNLVASISVTKRGTGAATAEEVLAAASE